MSLYRGRIYSVEDLQKLIFLKRYQEELQIYDIEIIKNSNLPRHRIEDTLIDTANVVLLLAIDRYSGNFISTTELNLIYDKIVVFMKNRSLLGDVKVFGKLMAIANDLHYQPFIATT